MAEERNLVLEPVNGFVLAGGKSSRIGQDKGLLHLQGKPLVEIAADLLATVCRQVFLLAPESRYPFLRLPAVPDRCSDGGPLVALVSALERSATDGNLFLPCDMPFLTTGILVRMLSLAHDVDAVVPQDKAGRWFPLSAFYRKRCLLAMESQLARGNFKVDAFFQQVVVRALAIEDYPEITFANINSRDDLARWTGG